MSAPTSEWDAGRAKANKSVKRKPASTVEQGLGELKTQSQMLRQQLSEVMFRLNQLEKKAEP